MIGAEITIDFPMVRAGLRHSPARIATNSKPQRAPKVILLKMLTLKSVGGGATSGSACAARSPAIQWRVAASNTSRPREKIVISPPRLITHLPTRKPTAVITTIVATSNREAARIIPLLEAIH